MNIKNFKNLQVFILTLSPGFLINILFLKIGHDITHTYGCRETIVSGEEALGWILTNLSIGDIYISSYLVYILLFISQTFIFLIYNEKLKIIPLIYIGLLNCTYPILNIHINILKQGLAISFTIFCICLFISKGNIFSKIISTILFALLAYFCHTSSIIILTIFLISFLASYSTKFKPIFILKENQNFIYNIKGFTIISFISFILFFIFINSLGYTIDEDSASYIILLLIFFIFYLYLSKDKYLKSKNMILLHNFILFFIIFTFVLTIFGFDATIIERFSLYILPIMIINLISISSFSIRQNNLIYYLGTLVLLFFITYYGGFYSIQGFYKC